MKGSSLDILVGAACGGMNGIITGVAWVRAVRAFRIVLAALLKTFSVLVRKHMKTSQPIWRKHGNTQQVGTGLTIS